MSAARDLSLAGVNVVLVEARSRIGGRLYTDEEGFEQGGQWIHTPHCNPVKMMADCLEVETREQEEYGTESLSFNDPSDAVAEQCEELLDVSFSCSKEDVSLTPQESLLQCAAEDLEYDPEEVQFIFKEMLRTQFELDSGPWDDIDAAPMLLDMSIVYRNHFSLQETLQGDVAVVPGYSHLVQRILDSGNTNKIHIKLNSTVNTVQFKEDIRRVQLLDAKGGAIVKEAADAVLVTVPLGVLKAGSITFDPSLSHSIQTAISNLGMAVFNKVWLTFESKFDFTAMSFFRFATGDTEVPVFDFVVNMQEQLGEPVLMAFTGGATALWIENATDIEVQNAIMPQLRQMETLAQLEGPIRIKVTRWKTDPFARGSYSYVRGGYEDFFHDMMQFSKRIHQSTIFFAGEHTTPHY